MTSRENQPVAASPRGDSRYTWEDTIAAIGKDFSGGKKRVAQETIDPTAVSRYCEVWEIGNPNYWYKDAAKQAGYRGLVVPWNAIKQTFSYKGFWRQRDPSRFPVGTDVNDMTASAFDEDESGEVVPMPPITQVIVTDVQIDFFEPACVGDRLTIQGNRLANVRPRKTRIGIGAFINNENDIYNQRGELVARVNQGMYSYNPE
ncbi:MAG: MaoC family dehydratase N-terminal domain-containing protein [Chloroflexota bacterium]